MSQKIFVNGLPMSATENELEDLFIEYGRIKSVKIIRDRDTGQSRGFAFVEMEDGADEAVEDLDLSDMDGNRLYLHLEKPRPSHGGYHRTPW